MNLYDSLKGHQGVAMKSVNFRNVLSWILWILGALFLLCVFAPLFLPHTGASKFKHSIAQAMQSPRSVTHLALFDETSTFPVEIKQFPNLEWLIVIGDEATELPNWIGQNQKLKRLGLTRFKLVPFPSGITELTQIEELYFYDCGIDEVPPTIGKLKSLEQLDLSENNLTDLPDEISQLSSLKFLTLNGNPLTPAVLERIRKRLPNTDVEFEQSKRPQPVQIKAVTPKEPFEWTRAEKKQFLEKLKAIKEGDKLQDVVKVLGPSYHTEQTVGKRSDDIRATVLYYYLRKKKDELTVSNQEFGPAIPKKEKRTDSNDQFDQYVALVFDKENLLAGAKTNITGLVLQSVRVANSEEAVLENLGEQVK